MRYFIIFIALTAILSGCALPETIAKTTPNPPSFTIKKLNPSPTITIIPNEEPTQLSPTPSSEDDRQPVILSHNPVGFYDVYSLFSWPVFIALEENRPYNGCFAEIYRTFYPWDGRENVFEALSQRINEKAINQPGEILMPFLLSNESVNLSDEELREYLSEITTSYVFSKHTDSLNYRLIAVNANTEKEYVWYEMTWNYYMQVWDEDHIWAQPLCEWTEFIFDQAVFVTESDGNELVLLSGHTCMPNGTGLAVAGTGFRFDNGIWVPIVWDETYDEVTEMENLDVHSDGIIMIIYPTWLMIPHNGPSYYLNLFEDGSFWADFYNPEYPENDILPYIELLFRLK